jgi:hypothetical protein
MHQYRTMARRKLVGIARHEVRWHFGQVQATLAEDVSEPCQCSLGCTPNLHSARMQPALPGSQSPGREHAAAPGILHFHGCATATRIFRLKLVPIAKVLATMVFDHNNDAFEQLSALGVVDLKCSDLTPRFIHLNHHVSGLATAPSFFYSTVG